MDTDKTTTDTSKTLLDADAPQDTPAADKTVPNAKTAGQDGQPKDAPSKPASLLDDETAKDAPDETPPPNAPSAEDIQKFTDGVKTLDLGDGVKWDDEALGAMTPALMELTGGDPRKADGVIKAYTEYQQGLRNKADEANQAYANELIAECQKRFGQDLKPMIAQAKAGGLYVFGESLWSQLRSVPQFANNPDLIERLAIIARQNTPDTGALPKKDGKTQTAPRDWREGMYGKGK